MFHQLYKYDVSEATEYRLRNAACDGILPNLSRNLLFILESENYLIKQFKTAVDILEDLVVKKLPIRDVMLCLRTPSEVQYRGSLHPGTLSRPREEIQSILYTAEPDGGPSKKDLHIMHRQSGGKLETMRYWDPLIDPMSYPLLFVYGNSGFKRGHYKLRKDYVLKPTEDDDLYREPYTFEGLNDEMVTEVTQVNYAEGRKKYKKYRAEIGEEVSESEEELTLETLPDTQVDEEYEEYCSEPEVEIVPNKENDALASCPFIKKKDKGDHFFSQDSSDEGGISEGCYLYTLFFKFTHFFQTMFTYKQMTKIHITFKYPVEIQVSYSYIFI